ncbi:MAG: MFS transporter [Gammaproteobacteria bacterium]
MTTGAAHSAAPPRPLALFANPAYRALWIAGAVIGTVRWLEMLAAGVYAYDRTGSPLTVAFLTILRFLPLALFGALFGALADRVNRQAFLLFGLLAMAGQSWLLGLLATSGRIELWHIGCGAFLNGLFWTTDLPVRRTLIGETVDAHGVGTALSLDAVTNNGTRMLGPLLGGLILEILGLDGAYFLSLTLYALGFLAIAKLSLRERRMHDGGAGVWASIVAGLRHVRDNRALAGTLMVTIIYNLWGFPFTAMIPVIGRETLHLSPFPVGLLAGAEGAGAFLGALAIAFFGQPRHYRKLYFHGAAIYQVTVTVFAFSPWAPLSGAVLLVTGLGAAAVNTMQATLVFFAAPAEIRSRMMGVLSMCIGAAPLGYLHLGLLADALGAPPAVALMAVEGLVALLLAYWYWPEIR